MELMDDIDLPVKTTAKLKKEYPKVACRSAKIRGGIADAQ